MPNKRLLNLERYSGVLPYASELFGVYQPMIGWHSKRITTWLTSASKLSEAPLIDRLAACFESSAVTKMGERCELEVENYQPADFKGPRLLRQNSYLLTLLAERLEKVGYKDKLPSRDVWKKITDDLARLLETDVQGYYNRKSVEYCAHLRSSESARDRLRRENSLAMERNIAREAEIAGAINQLVKTRQYNLLEQAFYKIPPITGEQQFKLLIERLNKTFKDPFETFDLAGDLKDVTLSPIGITHLFRQYFFELDTFLGSPVAHLYVPPGSTTELVEVSTRKTTVEKTIEQSLETSRKTETSSTEQDDISEAVKQDNKQDMKLGISSTVEQSWGTGNITATASMDMDKSQQSSRETTHKRMRQQSAKLTTEIRENYKTTFRTVTETTDTVSKRYVISNPSNEMFNYELRRKMRQVAVQVQDIGSYLCWDTFVDEPGSALGLANLVHMAKPADVIPVPSNLALADLADVVVPFTANGVWDYNDRQGNTGNQFVHIGALTPPPGPDGYELVKPEGTFPVSQISASGEDFHQVWAYMGRFLPDGTIELGVWTKPTGIGWDDRVDFVLQGAVSYRPNQAKKDEITAARNARSEEQEIAKQQNDTATRTAYFTSAKERLEQASAIKQRKYEDLREEERIVVYRRLIRSLMTGTNYEGDNDRDRHVLAQLLNTIFDIDKMLYFVAPEWWKPRERSHLGLGFNELSVLTPDAMISWGGSLPRPDNYMITDKTIPAVKGSSLGWLLQLDGDDLRNAFLNAPWVKAVLPVRPGRETAAINWLKGVDVEGSGGLDASYAAPDAELSKIREALGLAADHQVTLEEAISYLCKVVADKHAEGNEVSKYPETEITDDNKVLATPIEKVYEYGFYPLQGGFRIDPAKPGDDENNQNPSYQVFDQWLEILPTDQIVPVAVSYDPKTGQQI